jgi:hypothetical protein
MRYAPTVFQLIFRADDNEKEGRADDPTTPLCDNPATLCPLANNVLIVNSLQNDVFIVETRPVTSPLFVPILHRPHATGHTQCGADGGEDGDDGLNDEFPSFFFLCVHNDLFLVVND